MRIIPNQGVCDPHIRIYNGKVYMYATHDRSPENTGFYMDDWLIFSTDDLLNWKLEYTFRPEDTFLGKCEECYATDSAYRNGKYYLYFSHQQYETGVAVSDHPAGPYKDALGKPLLPRGMADTPSYDPAIFIDDDEAQTPYLVWGFTCEGKQYYMARLNEDMISLAEPPRPVKIINSWDDNDAPALNKWNGKYYLSSHRSYYATSDNVYGPYTYRGAFCTEAYTDHGNFFTFHNQTYFAYGIPENWGEEKVNRYYRTTKMVYVHFDENGDIHADEFIKTAGVGQYEATWPCIKGEWYFAASDGVYKKTNAEGFEMRGLRDGSYLYYQNVNGMRQNAKMYIRGRCESSPCEIEIREGSPFGALLGHVQIQPQAG
ncbi:MAG: family 43 glycosylhydrolase, partial [Clostridia bacterium]|nr:family 43 glycosylhydrolase [Clostridia bacterium]